MVLAVAEYLVGWALDPTLILCQENAKPDFFIILEARSSNERAISYG